MPEIPPDLTEGLVKDLRDQILMQHEARLRALELYVRIGALVGAAGVSLLSGILVVLLTR